jgi:hypothetical protein
LFGRGGDIYDVDEDVFNEDPDYTDVEGVEHGLGGCEALDEPDDDDDDEWDDEG